MATKSVPAGTSAPPAPVPSCTCTSQGTWTVKGTLANLLKNGGFSDVVFLVGENKAEVKAHQLLLVMRSEIFLTMFQDRWTASSASQSHGGDGDRALRIPLTHVSEPAFRQFLKYLYTDELDLKSLPLDDALEVMDLSHMYEVPGMVEACCARLVERIDVSSSLKIFMKAKFIGSLAKQLENKAFQFILSNLKEVFGSGQFLELDAETVEQFMKVDSLELREVDLVGALVRWAEHQGVPKEELCENPVTLKLVKQIRACQLESESSGPDPKLLLSQDIIPMEDYANHQTLLFIRSVLSPQLDFKSNKYRARKTKMAKVTLYRGTKEWTKAVNSMSTPKEEFRLKRHCNKLVFVNGVTLHPFQHYFQISAQASKAFKPALAAGDICLEISIVQNGSVLRKLNVPVSATENDYPTVDVTPPLAIPRAGELKFMVNADCRVINHYYNKQGVTSALTVKSGKVPSTWNGNFPVDKSDGVYVNIGFPENEGDSIAACNTSCNFIKAISCSFNIDPESCHTH